MIKRILITGPNGLIGRKLIKKLLLNKQNKITLVLRKKKLFETSKRLKIIIDKNLSKKNTSWWSKKIGKQDFVYHLAWSVKSKDYLTSKDNIDCLKMTIKIAIACKNKVKNFISLGTCLEYKRSSRILTPSSAVEPESLYAACKLSAFYILKNLFLNSKTNFKWLRVFYIYSEDDHSKKLIPTLIRRLKQNKKVFIENPYIVRDYIDLEDAIDQIIKSHTIKSTVQNVCSSNGISLLKLSKNLEKKLKKKNLVSFNKRKKVIDIIVGRN